MRTMLIQSAALLLSTGAALAQSRVIITEIMYNPASTEKKGETEWIEIANVGDQAIDIKDWTIRIDQKKFKWSRIKCTLAPGEVAVLVNREALDEEKFRAAWDQQPPSGSDETTPKYQIVGLKWGALSNNPTNLTLQLVNDKDEVVCEIKQDAHWPRINGAGGASVFLTDPKATNLSDGSLWRISQDGLDGAHRSAVTDVFDKADCGSPGYVPGMSGNPAATTPATVAKPKKPKQSKPDQGEAAPQKPAADNSIEY